MNDDTEMKTQKSAKVSQRIRVPTARQPLPSSLVGFDGQLRMLRAYVNASEGGEKPVSLDRLAAVSQISRTTASTCNRFFEASNLITKAKNAYKPTEGLISFVKQLPWNEERARSFLHNMMEGTWYDKELHVLFGTSPTMTREELIFALGSSVGARPDQKISLDTLVKFAIYGGLIMADADTGTLSLAAKTPPLEPEIGLQKVVSEAKEKRIEMGGLAATFAVNLNLTLDITTGTPDEHVKKIKDILKGLSKEE